MTSSDDSARKSPLERLLGLFAEVRAGEGLVAATMLLNIFLILVAYYVLKPIRDGLIANAELHLTFPWSPLDPSTGAIRPFVLTGDQLKAALAGVMAVLLIPIISGYGRLASRVTRIRLLNITGALVVGCVVLFFVLLKPLNLSGAPVAIGYFVWLGIINFFIIAQFWSYANDIYTEKQGKRLFAMIAIGQSTGAILGAWLARTYGKQHTFLLLGSAAVVLSICQLLYWAANRRVARLGTGLREPDRASAASVPDQPPMTREGGFELVLKSRYLLLVAVMILLANLVNTTGENIMTRTFVGEAARLYPDNMHSAEWAAAARAGTIELPSELDPNQLQVIGDEEARKLQLKAARKGFGTAFFGGFYFWVNLCGALLQAFIVSRFFKYFGVRAALFVLPILAGVGNVYFGIVATLAALRISKTAENSTDYSLQNTLKQALFLPTSREAKYKAKAAIDTFFVRLGDTLAAGLWLVGLNFLHFDVRSFAFVNIALVGVWLVVCALLAREHRRLLPDRATHAG